MTTSQAELETLVTKLSALGDPTAAVDSLIRTERAKIDAESHRLAAERRRLDEAELARTVAAERAAAAAAKEADLADARAFADLCAGAYAAIGVAAVGLVEKVVALYSLRSCRGRSLDMSSITVVLRAIAPFVDAQCGHLHASLSGWAPSTVFAQLGQQVYGADAAPIERAVEHVRRLDAATQKGGVQ